MLEEFGGDSDSKAFCDLLDHLALTWEWHPFLAMYVAYLKNWKSSHFFSCVKLCGYILTLYSFRGNCILHVLWITINTKIALSFIHLIGCYKISNQILIFSLFFQIIFSIKASTQVAWNSLIAIDSIAIEPHQCSIGPCSRNPCSEDATCLENRNGGFTCQCPSGKSGRNCNDYGKSLSLLKL